MSNSRKGKRSLKPKSEFETALIQAEKKSYDKSLSEEKRKERRYAKLEQIFAEIGDKKNRYIFYCPDIPFPCSLVKTIYQHANLLKEMGYTTLVMHETQGFKPTWLKYDWANKVEITYLSTDAKSKYTGSFNFKPTDSIIIPDGFWTVMEGFMNIKQVHKIVMAHGYGGIITTSPGFNWGFLGFTDVICVSENIKQDYQKLWPQFNYHVAPYMIDKEEFAPLPKAEIYPAIGLSCRSREDAQSIINIVKNRYPFLSMFDFRILKKLDTEAYADTLKHCCVQVVMDEKAGHPPMLLEAIAAGIPTIAVYGRGYDHFLETIPAITTDTEKIPTQIKPHEGVIFVDTNDLFQISEIIADFCLTWLENETSMVEDKAILDNYSKEKVQQSLTKTYQLLQQQKLQLFTAIKTAVDEGKLDETEGMFTGDEGTVIEQLEAAKA